MTRASGTAVQRDPEEASPRTGGSGGGGWKVTSEPPPKSLTQTVARGHNEEARPGEACVIEKRFSLKRDGRLVQ